MLASSPQRACRGRSYMYVYVCTNDLTYKFITRYLTCDVQIEQKVLTELGFRFETIQFDNVPHRG